MTLPRINADVIACKDKPNWLAERRKRVQASDGANILNGQAYPVYAEKVAPPLITKQLQWQSLKLRSERTVRDEYQEQYGGKVHAWPEWTIAASKEHPWLGCTPDSLVEDSTRPGIGIQQIKCWSEYGRGDWKDSPPLYVQVQTQIEMLVCGVKWGVIAVMFGTNALERFYIEPNQRFVDAMLLMLRDFWTCVELRTPPAIDGSDYTADALARLHPNDNGKAVRLSEGSDELLSKLQRAESLADRLTKKVKEIKNHFRAAIGDNSYGLTPGDRWLSWKSQDRSETVVSASTFRVLRTHKAMPTELRKRDVEFATPEVDYKVAERVKIPEWIKVRLLNQHPHCRWCGCQLTRKTMSIEHVTPLEVGGTNDEHNLDLACVPCNNKRGSDASLPTLVSSSKG